jgi:putative endonuclease
VAITLSRHYERELRSKRGNPVNKITYMKIPCVYIMASERNGTLYTGVTSNLVQRVYQHRNGIIEGFSKKYLCKLLVWYEVHENMESAILREKQIKAYSRKKKLELIETKNFSWQDLYNSII